MNESRHRGLILAFSAKELFWLSAWSQFLSAATAGLRFPSWIFLSAYFLAFLLVSGLRKQKIRFIWSFSVQGGALCLVAAAAAWSGPVSVFPVGQGFFQWYQAGLFWSLAALFWYKGGKLAGRLMSYRTICNYFDLGVAAFFSLYLVKLLVFYHSGSHPANGFTGYLMAGFFISGLSALFLSNIPTTREKRFIPGFRGPGLMLTALMILVAGGAGLMMAIMPLMTLLAESGYGLVKETAGPFVPFLVTVLRFILTAPGSRSGQPSAPSETSVRDLSPIPVSGDSGWFPALLAHGLLAAMLFLLILFLGALALVFFRMLMKRPKTALDSGNPASVRWNLKERLKHILDLAVNLLASVFRQPASAKEAFSRLSAWAGKSGVVRNPAETPLDYGRRLQHLFYPLEKDIHIILQAFLAEIYGEQKQTGKALFRIHDALKQIRRPFFWKLRLAVRFRKTACRQKSAGF